MFELSADRLGDGIRRVVDEQIGLAVAELRGETERTRDQEVHEARKRCKRVRAVLRLIRDLIGDDTYRRENVAVRDAARRIAGVRDAQILVTTLDAVVAQAGGSIDAASVVPARAALRAAHHRLRRRVVYRGTAVAATVADLTAVGRRSRAWLNGEVTFADLRPGIARVYRRGRARMSDAYDDPVPEHFHDWRKRVKDLWHHLELLRPAWPAVLAALAEEAHRLSDLLGDEHDRSVLAQVLHERPDLLTDPEAAGRLRAAIDAQRLDLQAAARPLGAKLYAESPGSFTGRLQRYWTAGDRG